MFQFGSGETAYFVILELYAGGNVVLTDCYYVVLNVLRTHSKDMDALIRVGRVYPGLEAKEDSLEANEELSPSPDSEAEIAAESTKVQNDGNNTAPAPVPGRPMPLQDSSYSPLHPHNKPPRYHKSALPPSFLLSPHRWYLYSTTTAANTSIITLAAAAQTSFWPSLTAPTLHVPPNPHWKKSTSILVIAHCPPLPPLPFHPGKRQTIECH
jgi:hypothetical protein